MADRVGADTDLLKSSKLEPVQREMTQVQHNFTLAIVRNNPPGGIRANIDKQIHDGLTTQIETVTRIIDGITRLARGDASQVDSLSKILANAEETNTDLANANRGRH
ncbi:hypothetical protein ACFOOK_00900 [Micromonospora krabiensis]|uniref:Uncharacterized protein n=1 Tax=Micromonospora krabiensis TaxID=307121 RepID=A0A1C3MXJ6_9ACTN|nr:hypothetical protein [Micromonospora krabiensis]SBV25060.1 hypothetical protein GA0070620_0529 [Micromonospora krabiensis]